MSRLIPRVGSPALLVVVLLASPALAATYFVAPGGNDANAGSMSLPWKTIHKAIRVAAAGDTVYFRQGDYPLDRMVYLNGNAGTADKPIVYAAYQAEVVTFTWDVRTLVPATFDNMLYVARPYHRFERLTFRETEGARAFDIANGQRISGGSVWAEHATIRDCAFLNPSGLGVFVRGGSVLVERTTISGMGHGHAFYISGADGVYRDNRLECGRADYHGQCLQFQYVHGIRNKAYGNLVLNGRAAGVVFSGPTSFNEVFNNVFVNAGSNANGSAVTFWCETGALGAGNKFYNNTLIGKTNVGLVDTRLGTPAGGTACQSTSGGRPLAERVEIRNNIFYPSAPPAQTLTTLSTMRDNLFSNIRGAVPANNVLANPLLVNAAGSNAADAMLRPGSPAIDSGKGSSPATDFAGVPRPSAFDVGAFEFRPPVAPPDVVISSLSFASGSVSVTLRNQGSGPTPLPVPVSLSLDGALRLSASSSGVLAPGASSTLSASLAIAPGVHSLVATANSPKAFDESSLSNNSKTISVGDVALAGHWQLDETSGPSALDVSGNSNHAAFLNSPSSAQGKFSNALDFSGATAAPASNDRLLIPDSNTLDFGTASFSYGLWVNAASTSGNYDMPWWKGGSSPGVPGYDFELGAGRWAACLSDGDEGLCAAFSSSPLLGRWVHLFAVVDRRAASLSLFVDGRLVSSSPIPSSFGSTSSSFPASIGASSSGPYPFKGRIDDVRVYSRALSPSEVAQLLMAPSAPRPPASLSVQ